MENSTFSQEMAKQEQKNNKCYFQQYIRATTTDISYVRVIQKPNKYVHKKRMDNCYHNFNNF